MSALLAEPRVGGGTEELGTRRSASDPNCVDHTESRLYHWAVELHGWWVPGGWTTLGSLPCQEVGVGPHTLLFAEAVLRSWMRAVDINSTNIK